MTIGRAIDLRRQRVVEAVRAGGGAQLAALPGSMGRTARGAFRGAR